MNLHIGAGAIERPEKPFESSHELDFLSCPWEVDREWNRFKIGTCHGLWNCVADAYQILAVDNDYPGNGHFEDGMEWFENSCRRDGKSLRIMELMNPRFEDHLIKKRGFVSDGPENLIKNFK